MKGEVISMSEFLDELERNKIIETARSLYKGTKNKDTAIQVIEYGLNLPTEGAQKIFESTILEMILA